MSRHTNLAVVWALLLGFLVAWSGSVPSSMASLTQFSIHGGQDPNWPLCSFRDCTHVPAEPGYCENLGPLCYGTKYYVDCESGGYVDQYIYYDTSSSDCGGDQVECWEDGHWAWSTECWSD